MAALSHQGEPLARAVRQNAVMPIFVVEYTYNDRPDLRTQEIARHRAYLGSLAHDGRLLGSGPYTDGSPGALLVFRVDGRPALDALLAADPFAVVGLIAAASVRTWDLVLGGWADGV
ncbi:MAG: YciI family protein [Cellulomonas sp.]